MKPDLFEFPLGTYESGIASYKHLYFNATENTMKIWILTVIAIIALYECTKHLISLMIDKQKKVRYSMIFLFCLSIFSHYYAYWAYVNYYNDDFYSQWNHQMFFTVNTFHGNNFRYLIPFFLFIPFTKILSKLVRINRTIFQDLAQYIWVLGEQKKNDFSKLRLILSIEYTKIYY